MAIKDETGDAFIREVDEEYRRAKLGTYWSRYGRFLLLGVGLLLLAVAGLLYWRGQQATQADGRAQKFAEALSAVRAGNAAKSEPILADLSKAPEPGYRALALLERAGAAATKGDNAGAARMYNAAAANPDLAKPFRDLAILKATQIEFDTLAPDAVIARLKPMALPGNPWFGTAGELSALAQLKAGRPELAKPLFDALAKDESVPVSLRQRAQQLASTIAPAPPAPSTPTPTPAPPKTVPSAPVAGAPAR